MLPELQRRDRQGAYIGVGPEQNLTYIAALKPSIAFIVDLQRGTLLLHLMYKALVELSADRADFMSRLFARPRPANVRSDASAGALFAAFAVGATLAGTRDGEPAAVLDRLTMTHGMKLSEADRQGIGKTYRSISEGGPNLRGDFGKSAAIPSWVPSYAEMMSQTDPNGRNQSFLGSEASFATLKAYESNNLIVPVVGDFAGGKALKAVGDYLTRRRLVVGTFYTSNVEDYLFRSDAWTRFFRNVGALPIDDQSMLIRTYFTQGIEGMREYVDPIRPMLAAVTRGDVKTYEDLITRSRVPGRITSRVRGGPFRPASFIQVSAFGRAKARASPHARVCFARNLGRRSGSPKMDVTNVAKSAVEKCGVGVFQEAMSRSAGQNIARGLTSEPELPGARRGATTSMKV